MKIGLYADPHVSQTSSIIVGKRGRFSGRLDNLVDTFNWMSEIFRECDLVICLGDMTDKPVLSAEEITAMSQFKDIRSHLLLVGNHCRSDKDGRINSLHLLGEVVYEPEVRDIGGKKVLLLPYSSTTFDLKSFGRVDVILSHNDIKGYDLGGHVLKNGYDLQDILDNCSLFINGHLHNGGWLVSDKVVNLGQVSGMNFSSCGGQWEPSVGVLDLDTLKLEIVENPVAYRFKKETFETLVSLKNYLRALPSEGQYVLQVRVPEKIAVSARNAVEKSSRVVASRVLTLKDNKKPQKSPIKSTDLGESKNIYEKMIDFLSGQSQKKFNMKIASNILRELEGEEGVE